MNKIIYAIIEINGKQYQIHTGKKIKVDKINKNINNIININKILAIKTENNFKIGKPTLNNYNIISKIIKNNKYKKKKIFKMRRRKHFQKHQGHRQQYTELKIYSITKNL